MTALVEARSLQKQYARRQGLFRQPLAVRAVDGINLSIRQGEVFGLIGESGCGKSTTLRLLTGLEEPTAGQVTFAGKPLPPMGSRQWKQMRQRMALIFQDPYDALNPWMRMADIVGEPLKLHRPALSQSERREQVDAALAAVELQPAPQFADRYAHELSGGQRQRVAIARALVLNPDFVAADEPTSMLDVSVRAGILNSLLKLKEELGLTVLFITHDLTVARYMCDRVGVMYNGRLVESGPIDEVLLHPIHPYTRALIRVVSNLDDFLANRQGLIRAGEAGEQGAPVRGCVFAGRCPLVTDRCRAEEPAWQSLSGDHAAACHYPAGG